MLATYIPMTAEEKFAIIRRHKNYIVFALCGGSFDKGDRVIVGSRSSNEDHRLITIKRVYRRSFVSECGLTFKFDYFGRLSNEDGLNLFSVETTYEWLNLALPLDDILSYLEAMYGCTKFQYTASISSFYISGFSERGVYPIGQFAVRKDPESALLKKRVELLNAYDLKENPNYLVVRFEDVRAWLDANKRM